MNSFIANITWTRNLVGLAAFALFLTCGSLRPFFPFFKGNPKAFGKHLTRNVAMGLLNAALTVVCFSFLWSQSTAWSANAGFGLLHRLGLPLALHACLAVLLLDVWGYGWHRVNHQLAWLWRFHRVHHSDPWMDVSTAQRFHPVEILISSILRLPLMILLGIHLWELLLYEMLLLVVIDFHHANTAVSEPVDRLLRTVLVTPAMHKVHHSRIKADTDSNYTSLLSIWDRIFGSFRLRPDLSAIEMGLDGWSDPLNQSLRGMLATPLHSKTIPTPSRSATSHN